MDFLSLNLASCFFFPLGVKEGKQSRGGGRGSGRRDMMAGGKRLGESGEESESRRKAWATLEVGIKVKWGVELENGGKGEERASKHARMFRVRG